MKRENTLHVREGTSHEGVTIKPDGQGRLLVTFPWFEERVEQMRSVPGRRWIPELKAWSVRGNSEMGGGRRKATAFAAMTLPGVARS